MTQFELSAVKPDFELIREQLEAQLAQRPSWQDILTASTGQAMLDFMAAIGAYSQLSIERAAHETMIDTARLQSSILALARTYGVHILRKRPAEVTVNILNSDPSISVSIPAYTQFNLGTNLYFNRSAIVFNIEDVTTQ